MSAPPVENTVEPAATVAPAVPQEPASGWPVWWWAAPLGLLVALGGIAALRRRGRSEPVQDEWQEPELAMASEPEPVAEAPLPKPAFVPVAAPASTPAPAPAPAASQPAAVEIAFEPVGLRLSLVFATLQYRVSVTAAQDMAAGYLLGDMIGAHGSIPPEDQLAPPLDMLTRLKPVPALAAGESVTIKGDIQLPLSAILPVRQNNASLFVPLVRLTLMTEQAEPLRRVYTVGLTGGAALGPLRLDTGPMEHRDLAAREVEAARAYPVRSAPLRQAVG